MAKITTALSKHSYLKAIDELQNQLLPAVYADVLSSFNKPSDLSKADQKDIQLARFEVLKQWKGEKKKSIEVYFWRYSGGGRSVDESKWISTPGFAKGEAVLLFIHEENGKKMIAPYWERYFFEDLHPYSKFNFVRALDDMGSGKTLDQVIKEHGVNATFE